MYYTVLYHTIYYTVLYYTILCYTVSYYAIVYYTIHYIVYTTYHILYTTHFMIWVVAWRPPRGLRALHGLLGAAITWYSVSGISNREFSRDGVLYCYVVRTLFSMSMI